MNKKIKIVTIILLTSLFLIPSIEAAFPEEKTILNESEEKVTVDEKISNNEENPQTIGKIYGYTHCSHGVWTWDPISHAFVRAGFKTTRSRSDGYYEISGLQIDRTYRVVALRIGYLRTVVKVKLTEEKPEQRVYIDMYSFLDWLFDLF